MCNLKKFFIILTLTLLFVFSLASCNSKNGDVEYLKGIQAFQQNDYPESITYMQSAIKLGVEDYDLDVAYTIMGRSYVELAMFDNAKEAFENALQLKPSSVEYITNLAVAYRNCNDLNAAENLYLKALQINPNYDLLNSSLGTLYIVKKEPEKAISYFKKAIDINPTIGVTYGNLAIAYAMIGEFEKANSNLEKARLFGYKNVDEAQRIINTYK